MNDLNTGPPATTEDAAVHDERGSSRDPDVLLDVPELQVDKVALTVDHLVADVDLRARVANLVDLQGGAHVELGNVELTLEKVHVRAVLKVRLDKVAAMVERVMSSIDHNPDLVTVVTKPVVDGVLGATGAGGEIQERLDPAGAPSHRRWRSPRWRPTTSLRQGGRSRIRVVERKHPVVSTAGHE